MEIRVYYEDTDCGGVVYHSNYLKFMERSRTELLRDSGIELEGYHKEGIVFAITEAQMKFRHPAVYNDLLSVESKITEMTSYRIGFRTYTYNQRGQLCCRGDVKMVAVDSKTGHVVRVAEEVYEQMNELYLKHKGRKK
jgi:acyl-CoA thioester hydrolase